MIKHQEKTHPSEYKYSAMDCDLLRNHATADATIKHRERGRLRRRLNIAKFEGIRTGNDDLLIQAGVDELMRMVSF